MKEKKVRTRMEGGYRRRRLVRASHERARMRAVLFGLGLLLAFAGRPSASAQDIDWVRQFGGLPTPPSSYSDDTAMNVDVDGNGTIHVAGYTDGTLPDQTSAGGEDVFVRTYDSGGNVLWTRQFGTAGNDYADGITSDDTGVYVAGQTYGALPSNENTGGADAFVRKYDSNGNELWTCQFGTEASDVASGICSDGTALYVAGCTEGTLPGQTNAGYCDAFVRKYDSNGNVLWTRQFGTTTADHAYGITSDDTGVYVAGETWGAFPGQTRAGGYDAFVRKYDHNGNMLWTRQFGTWWRDDAQGICSDGMALYVAGRTEGTLPGQTNACEGIYDAYVRKYNLDGTVVWTRQFGTGGYDFARGISSESTAVYVSGVMEVTSRQFDAYVRKYTCSGYEVWTCLLESELVDYAYGNCSDGTAVYVAGLTNGALLGNENTGNLDAFVAKLNQHDIDGVSDEVENEAPNNGDGNGDGIPDSEQDNVASLPNAADGQYMTLASPEGTQLADVIAFENPSPGDAPPGVDFPIGFVSFTVLGIAPGGSVDVTLFPGQPIASYYKYGPTKNNPQYHWYEFIFEGETGAEIFTDRVILHFVDGDEGDSDLLANGVIVDPGAPALATYTRLRFLPPLAPDNKRVFKRGSTIPVKFRIADAEGNPVPDAVATLAIEYLESGAPEEQAEVISTAAGDWGDQFRYDPEDDLYIFNLSTKDASFLDWYTYRLIATVDSGQILEVEFSLK